MMSEDTARVWETLVRVQESSYAWLRVPERLFDNPNTPEKEANGINAVKALSLAAHFWHSPASCVAKIVSQTVY